eukprot:m.36448 g.36448  ORF g.36448 m.36448 type:complete len:251 (+) comp44655_c0_seq1:182-934(+)
MSETDRKFAMPSLKYTPAILRKRYDPKMDDASETLAKEEEAIDALAKMRTPEPLKTPSSSSIDLRIAIPTLPAVGYLDSISPTPTPLCPNSAHLGLLLKAEVGRDTFTLATSSAAQPPYGSRYDATAAAAPGPSPNSLLDVAKTYLDPKWTPQMMEMGTKELNQHIKQLGLTEESIRELKKLRRRAKNRGYSETHRQRKRSKQADPTATRGAADSVAEEANQLIRTLQEDDDDADSFSEASSFTARGTAA